MTNNTKTKNETVSNPGSIKAGKSAFFGTLAVLVLLIAAYAVSHVVTFRSYGVVHFETDTMTADKQKLLISIAELDERMKTPMAIASPAIQALFHDLEHSFLRAESKDEISPLFDATSQALTNLGVHQDVSPKILASTKSRAIEYFSATDEEKALPLQLFKAELAIGQVWAREAIGAPSLLKTIEEFQEETSEAGYSADSEMGKSLIRIIEEIKNRKICNCN